MSLATADMKLRNIDRRVFKTRVKPLLLLDKLVDAGTDPYDPDSDASATTQPYTLIGSVTSWDYVRLGRGSKGEKRYRFFIKENDGAATPDVLARCTICFGNEIMTTISADAPDGEKESVAWIFLCTPSGETFDG